MANDDGYTSVRKDIEDAAVASEELGEMIKEMMMRTYGVDRTFAWYREGKEDPGMERSYNQFRSLILMRVYKELADAYATVFAMEGGA